MLLARNRRGRAGCLHRQFIRCVSQAQRSLIDRVAKVREELDSRVVGHDSVKDGLFLALVAREHAFVEGDPGSCKTVLANLIAQSVDGVPYYHQCHRDTRISDLIGETVIVEKDILDQQDTVASSAVTAEVRHGGILTANLAVIDDITRVPGEALNVLLRILNERQFNGTRLPLVSVFATATPHQLSYYTDPLEPATLDRFVIQLRTQEILQDGGTSDWRAAHDVLHLNQGHTSRLSQNIPLDVLHRGYSQLVHGTRVRTADKIRVLAFLRRLQQCITDAFASQHKYSSGPRNTGHDIEVPQKSNLLSDRTFLVKLLKLLKATAFLNGRNVTQPDDLRVVLHMVAFRVPADVEVLVPAIVESVILEGEDELRSEIGLASSIEFGEDISEQPSQIHNEVESEFFDSPLPDEQIAGEDVAEDERPEVRSTTPKGWKSNSKDVMSSSHEFQGGNAELQFDDISSEDGKRIGLLEKPATENPFREDVDGLSHILSILSGQLDTRSKLRHDREDNPGGQPRVLSSSRSLTDLEDLDQLDTMMWISNPGPSLPRAWKRQRKTGGGYLAIVRDISGSMSGFLSRWASEVVVSLLETAESKAMHVGYIEFNHRAYKFVSSGSHGPGAPKFFSKVSQNLKDSARSSHCDGFTNYEFALEQAMEEFEALTLGRRSKNAHILFLTDGVPTRSTQSDPSLSNIRQTAQELDVAIHTLFIGLPSSEFPQILTTLSEDTGGVQLHALRDPSTSRITVVQRE